MPPQTASEVTKTYKNTHFTLVEVQDMHRRFTEITKGATKMTKEQFREIMGFVDNHSSLNIVDRIFESLQKDEGVNSFNTR